AAPRAGATIRQGGSGPLFHLASARSPNSKTIVAHSVFRRAAFSDRVPGDIARRRRAGSRFRARTVSDGARVRRRTRHAMGLAQGAEAGAQGLVVRAHHLLRGVVAAAFGYAVGSSARSGARDLVEIRAADRR